ncbi:P-loop NTPase [Candidatus Woesearchaeota archaeon]|nr:P-loop NTPase [Candidatus Woesearchaeota archaeon]
MTKFIAVVSGKGGVGKTMSTINIGHALTSLGKKVVLVDANLVTPNVALQLGFMNPKGTLNKFLRREQDLHEITYLHESGLSVIPSSPSYEEFQKTNTQQLAEVFEHLDNTAQFVLIDAPSGLGYDVDQVLKNSDEVIVVVTPTIPSVMDALKTMQAAKAQDNTIAGILVNMSNKGKHELQISEIEQILGQHIIGNVPHNKKVRKALHQGMPVHHLFPRSKVAKEFRQVAQHLSHFH